MKKNLANWQRRALGLLSIGGGAVGLSSSMATAVKGGVMYGVNSFSMILGLVFFLWGMWCGIQMLEGRGQALLRNSIFWLAQVPVFNTSVFSYSAFCGLQFQLFIKLQPLDVGFIGSVFGAQFSINFGQPELPLFVGVNVIALLIWFWLISKYAVAQATPANLPN